MDDGQGFAKHEAADEEVVYFGCIGAICCCRAATEPPSACGGPTTKTVRPAGATRATTKSEVPPAARDSGASRKSGPRAYDGQEGMSRASSIRDVMSRHRTCHRAA